MFPWLQSLPFSEFGRLGITSQTHPQTYQNLLTGFEFGDDEDEVDDDPDVKDDAINETNMKVSIL